MVGVPLDMSRFATPRGSPLTLSPYDAGFSDAKALTLSPSAFSDCSQTDCVSLVKGQASLADNYDTYEEFLESAVTKYGGNNGMMVMNLAYSSDGSFDKPDDYGSQPWTSPMGQALHNNIRAWCVATGLPTSITIYLKDRTFHLHKYPLISRSGYLKRMLMNAKEVKVPNDCPGGPEIFEVVANFCYGSTINMEACNVAELRCAAEYLQMNEDYGRANLCERSDLYLTQVALQSWQDSIVVLLHCQNLCPLAEVLSIISRCVESLAFMACMEVVDPLERMTRPGASVESQFWSDISASTRDSSSPDWWMEDLLRLPCNLFERIIGSMRRQGMQEKYISQVVVKFVDRWVFTKLSVKSDGMPSSANHSQEDIQPLPFNKSPSDLVEAAVKLLPTETDAVPISFLFSLLRCALACDSSQQCKKELERRIACQMEFATINDIVCPFRSPGQSCVSPSEINCIKRIVSMFMTRHRKSSDCTNDLKDDEAPLRSKHSVTAVARIWDEYLSEVARDPGLSAAKFVELAEVVPSCVRLTHDHLYKAIHSYLKVHPHLTQEDRQTVCKIMNCQKLSQDVCTHAVQNDLMPLRMIVQAMFMQQLQTRNAISGHLESAGQSMRAESLGLSSAATSFRKGSFADHVHSESFASAQELFPSRETSFRPEQDSRDGTLSLGYIMRRDEAYRQAATLKADYEATECRLQSLEEQLASMKRAVDGSFRVNDISEKNQGLGVGDPAVPGRSATRGNGCISMASTEVAECSMVILSRRAREPRKPPPRIGFGLSFLSKALLKLRFGGLRKRRVECDVPHELKFSEVVSSSGGESWQGNADASRQVNTASPACRARHSRWNSIS